MDLVKLVHARGMKILTVFGAAATDYPQAAYLTKAQSGCQWGTYPLSWINLAAYQARIEAQFAAVRTAGESVDASAAPLMEALSHVRDPDGRITDYTLLVDGYGSHIYPTYTTREMIDEATASLRYEAAHDPRVEKNPIWIAEWNPSGSSFWNGKPWYFQYDAVGRVGGAFNRAGGGYPPMDRANAIRAFNRDVVEKLRTTAAAMNIGHVFYDSNDSAAKSSKCDHVPYPGDRPSREYASTA